MTSHFYEDNTASRQRLAAVVRGLSAEEFARSTPDGWTVSGLLGHLAFHDQRHLALLRRWKAHGVDESPLDVHALNEAMKPLCLALEPKAAAELCLASAAAIDAEVETITDEMLAEIQASGVWFRPYRSLHRNGHLDQMEALLGRGRGD